MTTLIIKYPNGAKQVIKPSDSFKGNFHELATAVAGPYWPRNEKIIYQLK